jgi:hypothetical protein
MALTADSLKFSPLLQRISLLRSIFCLTGRKYWIIKLSFTDMMAWAIALTMLSRGRKDKILIFFYNGLNPGNSSRQAEKYRILAFLYYLYNFMGHGSRSRAER